MTSLPGPPRTDHCPSKPQGFNQVTSPSQAFGLPYDVLELISEKCTRYALLDLCLVNTTLHTIAIKQLYRDPFGLLRGEIRDNGLERWFKLCRVLSKNVSLAGQVRSFSHLPWYHGRIGVEAEERVLPSLKDLTVVEWRSGALQDSVTRFIKHCPSRSIRSIRLPKHLTGRLEQSFWTWLEIQTELKELTLPWNCDPLPRNLSPFAFPHLEKLEAGPEVTRVLLPTLRSIRSFCSLSASGAPLGSLEDFEQVIRQFGEGLDSIRGLKVVNRDVAPLFRLLHTCVLSSKVYNFTSTLRALVGAAHRPRLTT
ncbi:hypothetical protein FRB93_000921 [Tulasnella sp. JGI-2019a]|nr:hypothetical protein FRB93_000921 [Tulasnella sp. JGI-2019a]